MVGLVGLSTPPLRTVHKEHCLYFKHEENLYTVLIEKELQKSYRNRQQKVAYRM